MKFKEFVSAMRVLVPRWLRHFGVMPLVLVACGGIERAQGRAMSLAWTTFVLVVYALGRVAYDRVLREMQEESDRRVAADIAQRMSGSGYSSEEFEAWYRAVRIVDLSRVRVDR